MSSTWPTFSSMRSSFQISHAVGVGSREQAIGVDEREIADQDRNALAEPSRLTGPPRCTMMLGEHDVRGRLAAPARRVVHHVVVEERERVHQLERCAGVDDDLVVGVATGRRRSPSDRTPDVDACRR